MLESLGGGEKQDRMLDDVEQAGKQRGIDEHTGRLKGKNGAPEILKLILLAALAVGLVGEMMVPEQEQRSTYTAKA